MGPFTLLVRHFFGRFFDNEIVSQTGDMRTNVVQAIGLVATPGLMIPFYMIPQQVRFNHPFANHWILLSDYYFFILYSMVVMGLVMVFQWDALFPDRRDYLILTPLPLSSNSIFAGKTAALVIFLGIFLVVANFFCTLLGPLVTGGEGTPWSIVFKLLVAHSAAVFGGGAFVALAIASLQGVLINVLTGRAFQRVSSWVQMAVMSLLIVALFLTPLISAGIRPMVERHSPFVQYFPPFWFLGLYLDLLPGRPAGNDFAAAASLARQAMLLSAATFTITYFAGYWRHARRVMQGVDAAPSGPGRLRAAFDRAVNRRLLPHPLERATFHFISNTILRSARQRLFLAAYAGIAIALAAPALIKIGLKPGTPLLAFSPAGLLVIPLTLSFFTVSGLRAVFNFPAELRANWIFQICESEERVLHTRAARKWIVVMGIAPLFALLAPFEIWFRGWRLGTIHLLFGLGLALVLLSVLLVWFRKIPFTCSYFPGKTSMAAMFLIYLLAFVTYSWTMAEVEQRLIGSPAALLVFFAAIAAVLIGLNRLERRERGIDDALIYEDEPDPIVRSLELG
jgi:hypothetical protein